MENVSLEIPKIGQTKRYIGEILTKVEILGFSSNINSIIPGIFCHVHTSKGFESQEPENWSDDTFEIFLPYFEFGEIVEILWLDVPVLAYFRSFIVTRNNIYAKVIDCDNGQESELLIDEIQKKNKK